MKIRRENTSLLWSLADYKREGIGEKYLDNLEAWKNYWAQRLAKK